MDDILIIGGGVVGLSLAYELSGRGLKVRLLDQGRPGRAASWAGAGVVPAAVEADGQHPHQQLAGLSCRLHPRWAQRLRDATGIDTGYLRSGALYLATQARDADSVTRQAERMRQTGVPVELLDSRAIENIEKIEPALTRPGTPDEAKFHAGFSSPGEAQIRNPRHLRALESACVAQGVEVNAGESAHDFENQGGRVQSVHTQSGRFSAEAVCVATGCWSKTLTARLGVELALRPIRGQIVLLDCDRPRLRRVINVGPRYLVPRRDGRLLIGSTQEDVGFDDRATTAGVAGLLMFALQLAPGLASARVERSWAGLRPGTGDGLPYLGPLPGLENAYLATGHFRSGLQLSPGTAIVMSQLIRGERPEVDLAPFRVDR